MNYVSKYYKSASPFLMRHVEASTLGAFRIFFGLLMLWSAFDVYRRGWIHKYYIKPEEGHYFSWRMKLRSKEKCGLRFVATNPETGEKWPIFAEKHLVGNQYPMMCRKPHMLIYYAHYLRDKLEETGVSKPVINLVSSVSLNYRPLQPLVDPNVNLANETYSIFKHADWILPLKE